MYSKLMVSGRAGLGSDNTAGRRPSSPLRLRSRPAIHYLAAHRQLQHQLNCFPFSHRLILVFYHIKSSIYSALLTQALRSTTPPTTTTMVLRQVADGQAGLPVPNSTHSYWHKEPSPVLLGHRTTAELPAAADVVIVGTGMTGAFAARFLKHARPSSRVVVLEAREACWGATGRNGGHCQPFLYAAHEDVARFELETYDFLRDLIAAEDIQCGWRAVPGAHAMLSDDVWRAASEAIPRLQTRLPDLASKIVLVGPEGVVAPAGGRSSTVPDWAAGMTLASLRLDRPGVKGAIVQRYAASMWPYKLVCWVLERLLAEHAPEAFNLQTGTPVTGISRSSSSSSSSNDAAEGASWVVQTPRGRIAARQVLLATNAYTSRLLPAFSDLVVPVRGQVGALLPPEPRAELACSYVFFGSVAAADAPDGAPTTRDEYLVQRPLPGGELILGGGRHLARGMAVGEWRDDVVEDGVAAWLRTELEPVLSLGAEAEGKEGAGAGARRVGLEASMEWTGIMGYSRDHAPWIGAVPESLGGGEGLFVASGFTGHGMPRCALAGRGVARMMTGDAGEEGHGLPASFVASAERAARAREEWGPVGTVDEMEMMIADLKAV